MSFNDFVFAALPWALGVIAIIGIICLILNFKLKKLESQAREERKNNGRNNLTTGLGTSGTDRTGDNNNRKSDLNNPGRSN